MTEINLLEREFLLAIDYRLSTTNEELNKYYLSLVESHPSYKIDNRATIASNQQRPPLPILTSKTQEEESGQDEEWKGKSDQDEEIRKSKRLRGKDENILLDPQTNPVENPPPKKLQEEPPQEDDKEPPRRLHPSPHHQQHLASSAPNILPDSIIEE